MIREEENNFEATNINAKWLDNIYENLKNLEMMQRLAKNGCRDLYDYFQIPIEQRQITLADNQFQNLKLMVGEFGLLLTDLEPVMDSGKLNRFREELARVDGALGARNLFLYETFSEPKKKMVAVQLKPAFYTLLDHLCMMRARIIKEIAHILYVHKEVKNSNMHKINQNILER